MKNLALVSLFAFLLISCGGQKKQEQTTVNQPKTEVVVLSVDDLYENAADMVDKVVIVTGTVMHVCKQGGGRCFLMGSNEDINIRVEAGEKIGAFNQEQMGSELEIVGVFKEVRTEADAHNPAGEHGEGELHEEDAETEEAHRLIAESEEASEVVYFIEGLKVKEL